MFNISDSGRRNTVNLGAFGQREIGVYWYLFSNHCTRECIHKKVTTFALSLSNGTKFGFTVPTKHLRYI